MTDARKHQTFLAQLRGDRKGRVHTYRRDPHVVDGPQTLTDGDVVYVGDTFQVGQIGRRVSLVSVWNATTGNYVHVRLNELTDYIELDSPQVQA